MDELIKQVSQKTGISEAQAKVAVETVLNFLKDKLPGPIAGRLDDIVAGAGDLDLDNLGDLAKGLGGLFGNK